MTAAAPHIHSSRRAPSARAPAALALALALVAAIAATAAAAKPPIGELYLASGATKVSQLSSSDPDAFQITIDADGSGGGRTINQLIGVSVEWDRVADYENPRWGRVFSHLGPSPVIRVGGSSAELLEEIPPASTWSALRSLAKACGAKFLINLKLSGGDLKFITGLYKRAIAELGPSIMGFELGNEPEYWPKALGGYSLSTKAFTPGWPAFIAYYTEVAKELVKIDGSYTIMGPSWKHFRSGITEQNVKDFMGAAKGTNLKEVAFHWYPPFTSNGFTAQDLLTEGLIRQAMDEYKNLVSWTGGVPVSQTEGNSKSKGGIKGVSDSFAAALWTADWAFEMAAAGAPRMLLHWRIGGSPDDKPGPHWPCYYQGVETGFNGADTYPKPHAPWAGYLLFARATLNGTATLARIPTAAAGPNCQNVKIWPLVVTKPGNQGKELRIVALNKKSSGACRVSIKIPRGGYGGGTAALQWMLPGGAGAAASGGPAAALASGFGCREGSAGCDAGVAASAVGDGLFSTRGDASVGGQTMDSEGRLQPAALKAFAVSPRPGSDGGSEYVFTLPGASGALVTVATGGATAPSLL